MWRVDRRLGVAAVVAPNVFEQRLFEECEAGAVQYLRVDGVVDDLERDEPYYVGGSRGSSKDGGADLPGLGVGAQLVEKLKGLVLQVLARRSVPGDFDRILDLRGNPVVSASSNVEGWTRTCAAASAWSTRLSPSVWRGREIGQRAGNRLSPERPLPDDNVCCVAESIPAVDEVRGCETAIPRAAVVWKNYAAFSDLAGGMPDRHGSINPPLVGHPGPQILSDHGPRQKENPEKHDAGDIFERAVKLSLVAEAHLFGPLRWDKG